MFSRRPGNRLNRGRFPSGMAVAGGVSLPPPALGLAAYLDADAGLTDSGDMTTITQAVGVATFTEGVAGSGPVRDDFGWGRLLDLGGQLGFQRAIQFLNNDWLVTSDASVLATFGATTTDFTVLSLVWAATSNFNQYVWGIGSPSHNKSIYGMIGGRYIRTASNLVGGTGTVSTQAIPEVWQHNLYPMLTVWRQTGTRHRIYVNNLTAPVLDTTFTWTIDPAHTRFAWSALPDQGPNAGQAGAMTKFSALYGALTDSELIEVGRYCGMRANAPVGGWRIDEITPDEWEYG